MGFKGFEDEALKSCSSHSRKRTKLKPSGMERSVATAQGSRVWGDGERPQKETFTSAPPAWTTLKGELDSQKVTQTDVRTLTWSSQGAADHFYILSLLLFSFFFFLLFCEWLEVLQKWDVCIKTIASICLCFLTLSLHSWIFWILQWDFIIMPDLYLTQYLPDRDDLEKNFNYSVYVLTRKKKKFLERLISRHAVRNSSPHIWSWHDSHRPLSQI